MTVINHNLQFYDYCYSPLGRAVESLKNLSRYSDGRQSSERGTARADFEADFKRVSAWDAPEQATALASQTLVFGAGRRRSSPLAVWLMVDFCGVDRRGAHSPGGKCRSRAFSARRAASARKRNLCNGRISPKLSFLETLLCPNIRPD